MNVLGCAIWPANPKLHCINLFCCCCCCFFLLRNWSILMLSCCKKITLHVPVEFLYKVNVVVHILILCCLLKGRVRKKEHLFRDWFWIQTVDPRGVESEAVKSEHWLANATDSTSHVPSLISHSRVMHSCKKCAVVATGFHFTWVLASWREQVRC